MSRELDDIFKLNAAPRVLVEANAGTGKTYTIVGIFVRLLLERELEVDQILTVTFTKKATAELRERILERLRECLETVEGSAEPEGDDVYLQEFYRRFGGSPDAAGRLRKAIHNFDDGQVFTIHGFCQKILQEEALIAGTPFEMNVSPTDQLLLTAADDFWRLFMHGNSSSEAGRYLISKMTSMASSPEELIGSNGIKPLLDKRYAKAEGEVMDDPKAYLQELIDLKTELRNRWGAERDEILDILWTCDISRYQTHLEKRITSLEEFFADKIFSIDAPDKLGMWTSDYLYDESNLKKKGAPVPHHDFFDLTAQFEKRVGEMKKVETTLLKKAFEDISERRRKLAAESETNSYNDLLVNIRNSLLHADYGHELADKLKQRYPVALVDEFQDTDPIQYEIFNAIYPKENTTSSLMMIGDPKQAIYAFRGADLHTYFRARNDGVDCEYTLMKNYRSSAGYIKSVNDLFEGERNPFIEEEIGYVPSEAGRKDHDDALVLDGEKESALTFVTRHGVEGNKSRATDFAFDQTVRKIGEILSLAENGKAFIGDEPVRAGDIAILISRHKDAKSLKRRLKKIGIDAVTKTDQTIYETLEATRLEMLMSAVLNPVNSKATNAFLLSGFLGLDLNDLHDLTEDDGRYQQLSDELLELQAIWYRRGFYAMFYELIHRRDRLVNLAHLDGAERVITNLYHLAELCASEERASEIGPRLLHRWLLRQMDEAEREEEKELQLESDQHLVKIMTIHSSKGLQFPLVFCPTLWLGRKPDFYKNKVTRPAEYHKKNDSTLYINIEREKTEQRLDAEFQSTLESTAEEVRKTYVALTRAQYVTYVFWETHSDTIFSGLGSSLVGRESVIDSITKNYSIKEGGDIDDSTFISRFKELSTESGGRIGLELVTDPSFSASRVSPGEQIEPDGDQLIYTGRTELTVQKKMESFSSLAGHSSEAGEPDYDQLIERYTEALRPQDPQLKTGGLNLFEFPKGATAGTAIHKLFELEEFDFSTIGTTGFIPQIEGVLEEYRFDKKWAPVLQKMLRNVAGSEMPGLSLNTLKNEDQIREMEFQFAATDADSDQLLNIIRNGSAESENGPVSNMFLTGFIDLIARQNGKYYILDYKSNFLGDSLDDYSQPDLKREILANSYDLQYQLYTVALVKYLRTRIPGFDYDQHVGGAAYLFVRGMKSGTDQGIWFEKPNKDVIENLETRLNRNYGKVKPTE